MSYVHANEINSLDGTVSRQVKALVTLGEAPIHYSDVSTMLAATNIPVGAKISCGRYNSKALNAVGPTFRARLLSEYRTEIGDATWVPGGNGALYLNGSTTVVAILEYDSVAHISWFGAYQDNTTYDTQYIRAAVQHGKERGGLKLDFSGGISLIGSILTPWHNQEWFADGRESGIHIGALEKSTQTIVWIGNPYAFYTDLPYFDELRYNSIINFHIHDMLLYSNQGKEAPQSTSYKTWGVSGAFKGITMERVYGHTFTYDLIDVFDGVGNGSLDVTDFSDQVLVEGCETHNCGRHGITGRAQKDFTVRKNKVYDCVSRGIDVEMDNADQIGGRYIVDDNEIWDVANGITFQGYNTADYDEIISIINNKVKASERPIDIDTKGSAAGFKSTITIDNNNCVGGGQAGIIAIGLRSVITITNNHVSDIDTGVCDKVRVEGNKLVPTIDKVGSISVSACNKASIIDNEVDCTGRNTNGVISISSDVKRAVVAENFFKNPLYSGSTNGIIRLFSAAATTLSLRDNHVEDDRATALATNWISVASGTPKRVMTQGNTYVFTDTAYADKTGFCELDLINSLGGQYGAGLIELGTRQVTATIASLASYTFDVVWPIGSYLVQTSSAVNTTSRTYGLYLVNRISGAESVQTIVADGSLTVAISGGKLSFTSTDSSFSRTVKISVSRFGG